MILLRLGQREVLVCVLGIGGHAFLRLFATCGCERIVDEKCSNFLVCARLAVVIGVLGSLLS